MSEGSGMKDFVIHELNWQSILHFIINLINFGMGSPDKLCEIADVSNQKQYFTMIALLSIQIIIFGFVLYRIIFTRIKTYGKQIYLVHVLLVLWAAFSSTDYVANLVWYRMTAKEGNLKYTQYPMYLRDTLPRLMSFCDKGSVLTIQTLLIIVPYFWVKNIIEFIKYTQQKDTSKTQSFNKILKLYIVITRIVFGSAIISQVFVPPSYVNQINKIFLYIISLEALLTCVVLLLGLKILLNNFKLIAETEENSINNMNRQCAALILACLARCTFDVVAIILDDMKHIAPDECLQNESNYAYCIFLTCVIMIMHFLPATTLLFIYTPANENSEMSVGKSVLGTSFLQNDNIQ